MNCDLYFVLSETHKIAPDAQADKFVVTYDSKTPNPGPHTLRIGGQNCSGINDVVSASVSITHYKGFNIKVSRGDSYSPRVEVMPEGQYMMREMNVGDFMSFSVDKLNYIIERHEDEGRWMIIVYLNSHEYR